jgi:hypothetical protein
MDAPERAAADGEILAVGGDRPAVDEAGAADHAVVGQRHLFHAEAMAGMLRVHPEFLVGARVEKQLEPLAGAEDALVLAFGELVLATGLAGLLAAVFQFLQQLGIDGHEWDSADGGGRWRGGRRLRPGAWACRIR